MNRKVITVIADLVDSRSERKRQQLQESLKATLQATSAANSRVILSPHTLTLGDEFQAVYGLADGLFLDLFRIVTAVFPSKLRFSLAVGTLTTKLNRQQAIGMDGPAFHAAREGMDKLKQSSGLFLLSGDIQPFPDLLNSALAVVSHSMLGWRKNRLLILMGLLEGRKRQDIAGEVGISLAAFHKNLQAGALSEMGTFFEEIENALNSRLSKQ